MNQDTPGMVQNLKLPETVNVINLTRSDNSSTDGAGDGKTEFNYDKEMET